jgi:1-deoxy-D-xylulose-5-phosphate reductoisomerase
MKKLLILGATGSIGQNALDVVREHPDLFRVTALAAGNNVARLAADISEFRLEMAAVADPAKAAELGKMLPADSCRIFSGAAGIVDCVRECGADLCLSAIVGSAGLRPTLAAIDAGMDIALANKESLVAAGEIVMTQAAAKRVNIIPVDSEHSALFQCLGGRDASRVRKLIITASGGPFLRRDVAELHAVTPKEARAHPTWNMGAKITVDSATLANKALEVMEAHWLFSLAYAKIQVTIHPQSIVHGLVEFADGSMLAQLGNPDMRGPIRYALGWPERLASPAAAPDLAAIGRLEFEEPDCDKFPLLPLGLEAGRRGGTAPAIYSAANEEAVGLFLSGKLSFTAIADAVRAALENIEIIERPELAEIEAAEKAARDFLTRRFSA